MEKQEKQKKKILTENRLVTVNKRETSYEGLASQLENGEDGIYNLINENKSTLFQPKMRITAKDLAEIEPLRQLRSCIEQWERLLPTSSGKEAYVIKKSLIEMRKDQYLIKNFYTKPVNCANFIKSTNYLSLDSQEWIDEEGNVQFSGFSLLNYKVCANILQNYSKLKEEAWGNFNGDLWYVMEDFDNLARIALADSPLYATLVELKVDGRSNQEIQTQLQQEYGIKHSLEYISSLWCNKIPKMIASAAEDQFLDYYYLNVEKGKYKKCSKCGEIKLAHNKYFSKNNTSKDGFYSICKKCRNTKKE